jgi:hypothetical protein
MLDFTVFIGERLHRRVTEKSGPGRGLVSMGRKGRIGVRDDLEPLGFMPVPEDDPRQRKPDISKAQQLLE